MNNDTVLPERIEFSVGETYTNEKGPFEVISIKRNEMVIRWKDGKEITTDIDLQRKIQERRLWEKQLQEKEKTATRGKSRAKSKGKKA